MGKDGVRWKLVIVKHLSLCSLRHELRTFSNRSYEMLSESQSHWPRDTWELSIKLWSTKPPRIDDDLPLWTWRGPCSSPSSGGWPSSRGACPGASGSGGSGRGSSPGGPAGALSHGFAAFDSGREGIINIEQVQGVSSGRGAT